MGKTYKEVDTYMEQGNSRCTVVHMENSTGINK